MKEISSISQLIKLRQTINAYPQKSFDEVGHDFNPFIEELQRFDLYPVNSPDIQGKMDARASRGAIESMAAIFSYYNEIFSTYGSLIRGVDFGAGRTFSTAAIVAGIIASGKRGEVVANDNGSSPYYRNRDQVDQRTRYSWSPHEYVFKALKDTGMVAYLGGNVHDYTRYATTKDEELNMIFISDPPDNAFAPSRHPNKQRWSETLLVSLHGRLEPGGSIFTLGRLKSPLERAIKEGSEELRELFEPPQIFKKTRFDLPTHEITMRLVTQLYHDTLAQKAHQVHKYRAMQILDRFQTHSDHEEDLGTISYTDFMARYYEDRGFLQRIGNIFQREEVLPLEYPVLMKLTRKKDLTSTAIGSVLTSKASTFGSI